MDKSSTRRISIVDHATATGLVPHVLVLQTPGLYATKLAAFLLQHGYAPTPINYPVVPVGKERLRLCVHASNSREEVNELVGVLSDFLAADSNEERERHPPVRSTYMIRSVLILSLWLSIHRLHVYEYASGVPVFE